LSKIYAPIKFYNSLTGKKQVFKPLNNRVAKIYACGPTVYNFAHLGNLRTYIFEDILRRTIKLTGLRVLHVMNITDIDDKIIKSVIKSGKKLEEITLPFEKRFFEDTAKLNIEKPDKTPRATEHVKEMIALNQKLIKNGFAYTERDDSVYFSISKFKNYGKLSHPDLSGQRSASRTLADEYKKDEVKDFALWKSAKPGEPSWDSPWGAGRPGWHIECSAMAMKYLGNTLDIHAGGVDNMFPHHDNEIAQSEAATGKIFSRFFMHGEHLLVDGAKMAKSAGNFYTLKDIEAKGYNPIVFRYLCLQTHYRSKMNFSWGALEAAKTALENIRQIVKTTKEESQNKQGVKNKKNKITKLSNKRQKAEMDILRALRDDLNTPKALAVLWKTLKDKNIDAKDKIAFIKFADRALGLRVYDSLKITHQETLIPSELKSMADKREKLRQQNDYISADKIRKTIEKKGYKIIDMPVGYKLKKI